jgi:hypothetical protein
MQHFWRLLLVLVHRNLAFVETEMRKGMRFGARKHTYFALFFYFFSVFLFYYYYYSPFRFSTVAPIASSNFVFLKCLLIPPSSIPEESVLRKTYEERY